MPTSISRDLIARYAKWQEAGGVRQSIMISNRRGSAVSNEDNEPDADQDGDIVAWDFDPSFSDFTALAQAGAGSSSSNFIGRPDETSATQDPLHTRPLRSPSQGHSNISPKSVPPVTLPHGSASEHPLEQLFNDGTVRLPPPLRARKDTLASRPVSPLPLLAGPTAQPSSPDMDQRPGTASGTTFDLRLPDIDHAAPIQIEIPATEETLRKDPPGVRSRSATVTRGARSDSTGSSGFPARIPRHNTAEPMPQPQSPPRSNHGISPKPQPPLPTPVLMAQGVPHLNTSKTSAATLASPKTAPSVPPVPPIVPPTSPPKGHMPSKSVPSATPLYAVQPIAPLQEHVLTKARSTDLKASRPPNLTLNVIYKAYYILILSYLIKFRKYHRKSLIPLQPLDPARLLLRQRVPS